MAERLDLEGLEARLIDLGRALELPVAAPGLAASVGARLRAEPGPIRTRRRGGWVSLFGRPVRRSLLVAVVLLLALATVAAAVGWWLPGLRIVPAAPGATQPAAVGPAGAVLGAGTRMELSAATTLVGFEPLLPLGVGQPDEVYVADRRLTLVWKPSEVLRPMPGSGLGLVVTELRGEVDRGFFEKQVTSGTDVEAVLVGGRTGYWLSGEPHALVYRDPSGAFVEETRRVVGDVLVWQRDELTLRVESALGRAATIELAKSMTGR